MFEVILMFSAVALVSGAVVLSDWLARRQDRRDNERHGPA